ncbi:L-lysine 6-monooxygenase (NADPH-requiring)-domain-containing protein [Massariosphaeria phaeospora]|uniref:L-ornithine N(5)-monooxygenase [NAD(P)H] n=1 Tax=Massariosphaeria phaeospora TaxID=100035 RepID=A0A7C8IDI4_9PLEO|nr:L-lysine 6-monooxygenase (NADPH-requiring)-domain-containing protein [Massariosphaeria phaeospora]
MPSTQQTPKTKTPALYDLICIGFGPAQIATAIANREFRNSANVLFLERKPSFSWYPSAHVPRTRMEHSFIYDLATTRNPKSAFSYTSYLLAQGRLVEFANSDRLSPLRAEFEEYLRWCAGQFTEQVRYQSEAVSVDLDKEADPARRWNITVKTEHGQTYVLQTRNIIAPAPSPSKKDEPKLPSLTGIDFESGQRILSINDYLSRANDFWERREPRWNVAIIGSSQEAIEVLDDIVKCDVLGNVTMITENESLAPLKLLNNEAEAPSPRLCSIWAKPPYEKQSTMANTSQMMQEIYTGGYEKQVTSEGRYALRVVIGKHADETAMQSTIIITENTSGPLRTSGLFQGLDALVLGCRQKGESLEEVQFKRGIVADGCRMWLMSARSEGGRSLAKDIAVRAGEVVKALARADGGRDGQKVMSVSARM